MAEILQNGTVEAWRSALNVPSNVSDRNVILIAAAVEDCGSSPASAIRWLRGKEENADKVWVGLKPAQRDLFEQIVSLEVGPHTWPTKPQQPPSGGEPSTPASGIHSGFAAAASCSAAPAAAVSAQAHIPATLPVSAAAVEQQYAAAAPSPEGMRQALRLNNGTIDTCCIWESVCYDFASLKSPSNRHFMSHTFLCRSRKGWCTAAGWGRYTTH